MGGGEAISWYAYAKMIFEVAGISPQLQPTDEREYRTAARRPKFSALSNSKLEGAGINPMPPLREAVAEYFRAREHAIAHRSA
jgi:dTDP-4-dehydrorhamnose reductase